MYAFLLSVLCNFLCYKIGVCSWNFHNFHNILSFNDLDLPDNLTTGSADVRSRLECFILCQKNSSCVTIFVKMGAIVDCKFSDKPVSELNGQLTKERHYKCFSLLLEEMSPNGRNESESTTYDSDSVSMGDPVISSLYHFVTDWSQTSDRIQSSWDSTSSPLDVSYWSSARNGNRGRTEHFTNTPVKQLYFATLQTAMISKASTSTVYTMFAESETPTLNVVTSTSYFATPLVTSLTPRTLTTTSCTDNDVDAAVGPSSNNNDNDNDGCGNEKGSGSGSSDSVENGGGNGSGDGESGADGNGN